jgi:hypothetical protein
MQQRLTMQATDWVSALQLRTLRLWDGAWHFGYSPLMCVRLSFMMKLKLRVR